ncbi:golgin subfamily A member 3-like [Gossypium australe]|uniref:Golgin subfamily A member 3-like n=1 Tax=Gossypium australe TaxID=47621 RepID=A0A5B6VNT5_9ROSI|nr:golgin subfamily A member 3-like [Gossypium australe]
MNEAKTMKQYADRIMAVVNSIRFLGDQFSDSRVIKKVLTTLPERPDVKCSACKQLGHLEKVFKNKRQPQ